MLFQEAVVSCWLQFSDGAVIPLAFLDPNSYQLTVSTPDDSVATVRRTPRSTFVVARADGGQRGVLVRAELRICEECQKSKRKSRLVVGSALLKIDLQGSAGGGGVDAADGGAAAASEAVGRIKSTVATKRSEQAWVAGLESTHSSTTTSTSSSTPPFNTTSTFSSTTTSTSTTTTSSTSSSTTLRARTTRPEAKAPSTPSKRPPPTTDLVTTFRALGDLEVGVFALVGVCCAALLAFLLNCATYRLRKHKTPTQVALPSMPTPPTKDHKHDWVWLGSHRGPPPNAAAAPPPQRRPPEASSSSAADAAPERTATLGRSRSSNSQQQHKLQQKGSEPLLLVPPPPVGGHAHQLHSPTSKRNQVQFTTFTTLDVKHLAALRSNGMETGSNWGGGGLPAPPPLSTLPDRPWPVVTPMGEPQ